jgi:hypothetical protein
MAGQVKGTYKRTPGRCEICKKDFKNIILHNTQKHNPDKKEDFDIPKEGDISEKSIKELKNNISEGYDIQAGEPEQPRPRVDRTTFGEVKEKAKKFLDRIQNSEEVKAPPIEDFKELMKTNLNRLMVAIRKPYLKFTDEEIEKLAPDIYYFIDKYLPELWRWLKNDIVRGLTLFFNTVQIIGMKIVIEQTVQEMKKKGKSMSEIQKEVKKVQDKEFQDMIDNNPELKALAGVAEGLGANLDNLFAMAKKAKETGEMPSVTEIAENVANKSNPKTEDGKSGIGAKKENRKVRKRTGRKR